MPVVLGHYTNIRPRASLATHPVVLHSPSHQPFSLVVQPDELYKEK